MKDNVRMNLITIKSATIYFADNNCNYVIVG